MVGAAALVVSIFWAMGADGRPLGAVLSQMRAEPWTVVTLVDLYLGFLITAFIIYFFEEQLRARLFWIVPIFFLGNVWPAIWLIVRLPEIARRLKG